MSGAQCIDQPELVDTRVIYQDYAIFLERCNQILLIVARVPRGTRVTSTSFTYIDQEQRAIPFEHRETVTMKENDHSQHIPFGISTKVNAAQKNPRKVDKMRAEPFNKRRNVLLACTEVNKERELMILPVQVITTAKTGTEMRLGGQPSKLDRVKVLFEFENEYTQIAPLQIYFRVYPHYSTESSKVCSSFNKNYGRHLHQMFTNLAANKSDDELEAFAKTMTRCQEHWLAKIGKAPQKSKRIRQDANNSCLAPSTKTQKVKTTQTCASSSTNAESEPVHAHTPTHLPLTDDDGTEVDSQCFKPSWTKSSSTRAHNEWHEDPEAAKDSVICPPRFCTRINSLFFTIVRKDKHSPDSCPAIVQASAECFRADDNDRFSSEMKAFDAFDAFAATSTNPFPQNAKATYNGKDAMEILNTFISEVQRFKNTHHVFFFLSPSFKEFSPTSNVPRMRIVLKVNNRRYTTPMIEGNANDDHMGTVIAAMAEFNESHDFKDIYQQELQPNSYSCQYSPAASTRSSASGTFFPGDDDLLNGHLPNRAFNFRISNGPKGGRTFLEKFDFTHATYQREEHAEEGEGEEDGGSRWVGNLSVVTSPANSRAQVTQSFASSPFSISSWANKQTFNARFSSNVPTSPTWSEISCWSLLSPHSTALPWRTADTITSGGNAGAHVFRPQPQIQDKTPYNSYQQEQEQEQNDGSSHLDDESQRICKSMDAIDTTPSNLFYRYQTTTTGRLGNERPTK